MPANVNLLYLPRPKKHNSPGYQYKEAQDQVLETKHASVCHKHNVCPHVVTQVTRFILPNIPKVLAKS